MKKQITIPARLDRLDTALEFIGGLLTETKIDSLRHNNIMVAVEEIFVNIANYAYLSGEGEITLCVETSSDKLTVKFIDSGIAYNPLKKEDPDITMSAEDREIGGLGIFMVKKLMDEISYNYCNKKNILTIVKNY